MPQAGVIDSLYLARAALEQRGVLGVEQLPRLAKMQCSTQGLEYHLRGGRASNGKRCLRFSVRGSVQMPCQRCLDPLPVPIAIDAELQLGIDRDGNRERIEATLTRHLHRSSYRKPQTPLAVARPSPAQVILQPLGRALHLRQ